MNITGRPVGLLEVVNIFIIEEADKEEKARLEDKEKENKTTSFNGTWIGLFYYTINYYNKR